jgi:hypothetical protein
VGGSCNCTHELLADGRRATITRPAGAASARPDLAAIAPVIDAAILHGGRGALVEHLGAGFFACRFCELGCVVLRC